MDQRLSFYEQRTIKWDEASSAVVMIDQTLLPSKLEFIECRTVPEMVDAIKTMKVRGAPAIGVAGAMGVALAVAASKARKKGELFHEIESDVIALRSARPTAVNLSWGIDRSLDFIRSNLPDEFDNDTAMASLVGFVERLADVDVETNKKLSGLGAKLFHSGDSVLTHCN